jgi:hypothetical protein
MTADCPCLDRGPRHPDAIVERDLGADPTDGRYADVSLIRCARCRRLWLREQLEYEAFSRSGRWSEAPIDEATAVTMTAEAAHSFVQAAPWRIVGGSFYGHAGKRVDSGLDFGTPPDPASG